MKIYVASSWRNEERQQATVRALREVGHDVYDFRNPAPGDHGFSWTQIVGDDRSRLTDPRKFIEVLAHPIAQRSFDLDMAALSACDACVLVLSCGRSAHFELGWAAGAGKRTVVLFDDPLSEPELMYLACQNSAHRWDTRFCCTVAEVVAALTDDVLHYQTDEGQPYGSASRKCLQCGVRLWIPSDGARTDSLATWETPPPGYVNCRRAAAYARHRREVRK